MKNPNLRRAVASLPCANCGLEMHSQAAHSNEWKHGKGRGMKAWDSAIFPLCGDRPGRQGCHSKFDLHSLCLKEDKSSIVDSWIADTYIKLMNAGYLKVCYKG